MFFSNLLMLLLTLLFGEPGASNRYVQCHDASSCGENGEEVLETSCCSAGELLDIICTCAVAGICVLTSVTDGLCST